MELFCKKAGINLVRDENFDLLDEAMNIMLDRFEDTEDEDDFGPDDLAEMLESMSEKELRSIPDFMIDQIKEMAQNGLLPESIAEKMKRLLK